PAPILSGRPVAMPALPPERIAHLDLDALPAVNLDLVGVDATGVGARALVAAPVLGVVRTVRDVNVRPTVGAGDADNNSTNHVTRLPSFPAARPASAHWPDNTTEPQSLRSTPPGRRRPSPIPLRRIV